MGDDAVRDLPPELRTRLAPLFQRCVDYARELNDEVALGFLGLELHRDEGLVGFLELMREQAATATHALATQAALAETTAAVVAVLEEYLGGHGGRPAPPGPHA